MIVFSSFCLLLLVFALLSTLTSTADQGHGEWTNPLSKCDSGQVCLVDWFDQAWDLPIVTLYEDSCLLNQVCLWKHSKIFFLAEKSQFLLFLLILHPPQRSSKILNISKNGYYFQNQHQNGDWFRVEPILHRKKLRLPPPLLLLLLTIYY